MKEAEQTSHTPEPPQKEIPRRKRFRASRDCILLAAAYLFGTLMAGILQALCDAEEMETLAYYLSCWRSAFAASSTPQAVGLFGTELAVVLGAAAVFLLLGLSAVGPLPIFLFAMLYGTGSGLLSAQLLTGLGGKKDFSVHQFGQAIGEKFDIYHGETLSATWASYARYVAPTNFARFARYARNVWGVEEADDEKAAMAGIDATEAYFKRLGMPVRIAELSCGVQDEAGLYDLALRCSRNRGRTIGSFRVLDFEDMLNVYQMANK